MLPEDHQIALLRTLQNTNSGLIAARWDYYRGHQQVPYLTDKLRAAFGALSESFVENYCALAVDSRIDRLEVTGFDGPGETAAQAMWDLGGYRQRQDQMFRWALVEGAAYLIVDDDQVVANPARVAYAQPSVNDWLTVDWAGKIWPEGQRWKAILWDEENKYYYNTSKGSASEWLNMRSWNTTTVAAALTFEGMEPHGYGKVPVFPINPYGDMASPLLDRIAPIQDRINKIISNTHVVLEFNAFKQRVFFTRQDVSEGTIRQQPDTAIVLDPGDPDGRSSVVELGGSDLTNHDRLKEATVHALFTVANLPRHMLVNPGHTVSGEAIKADEGPFVAAVRNHQREFGQAFSMALDLIGVQAEPVWKDPETRNDESAARTFAEVVAAGVPWEVAAIRYLGFTQQDVEEALVLRSAATAAQAEALTAQTTAFLTNPLL